MKNAELVEAKQSVPWANLYKKVRSMLVDTGASGSLSYKDAGGYLVGATQSAYTIGTANKKGSMNGILDENHGLKHGWIQGHT